MAKTNKKFLSFLLILVLAFTLMTGCTAEERPDAEVPPTVSAVVNVAALNGPTGMGMVKLMDMTDKYAITTYQAPTDIAPKLISGEVDVAALPSNMAAVLYNKTEGKIAAVSPIALGVLYILGNNADVSEPKDLAGKLCKRTGRNAGVCAAEGTGKCRSCD